MAKWENLKIAVAAVVKTNGNKEITGANMQAVLNSIINAVGGNAGFAGIATPTTNPSGIPDGPTFYIATQGGTYSYFPTDAQSTPATIQDGVISVLYNQGNGLWVVTTTPMSIADGSVTTGKLATGAVTAEKIADNAVGTNKIANNSVTAQKIANESISQQKLQFEAVGTDNIRNNAVTTNKIAQEAVGNQQLAANSVTAEKIGDGSITTSKITNGAVTGEKIANGTITGAKIADGTITGNEIAPNSIESSNLSNGAVDNDILADGAVTSEKLAPFAVDTGNIENKAVTKGKLDDDVVAILDEVDNKANIDGFYETMGVGTARNLLGKTSVVDTFFRKIIGVGVAKGNAYVDGVRGNSVAWKQLVQNGNFANTANWTTQFGISASIANNVCTLSLGAQYGVMKQEIGILTTHKYYVMCEYYTSNEYWRIGIGQYNAAELSIYELLPVTTIWSKKRFFADANSLAGNKDIFIGNRVETQGDLHIKNVQVLDLTALGIDYLTTPNEVEEWIASNVGDADYFPYNAGVILNAMMESIKSTGTTIGIKTKELPITGITGNHLGTRSTIFPDGMRGVGNGYDEISGNSAIVRIASVKVSELEWVFVEDSVFVANIPNRKYGNGIIVLCDKYASQPRGVDKGIYAHTITDSVLVMDSAYQSVAAFKTAMGDATILYELAEPIEYSDLQDEEENDFSLPIGIEIEPLGTLETLPQNTEGEDLTMCAPTLSMQFIIDAAKILTDELPNEYRTNADDKANWNKFLALMNEKLSSTMGGTISVDDAAVGHGLDFTFAAAQAENNRDVEPIEE